MSLTKKDLGILRMVVRKSRGVDYHSYGHIDVLDQLIEYDFVKIK